MLGIIDSFSPQSQLQGVKKNTLENVLTLLSIKLQIFKQLLVVGFGQNVQKRKAESKRWGSDSKAKGPVPLGPGSYESFEARLLGNEMGSPSLSPAVSASCFQG